MNYQPKHMREQQDLSADSKPVDDKAIQGPPIQGVPSEGSPMEDIPSERTDHELPDTVHPLGIPVPDPGDGGEYVPIPGRGSVEQIAPNGAVIRNPWSEQPEIKPDYAYTDEQDDMNLLIM